MLAFYLPQFHPIPENDAWWGKGFTEWANVANAKPNFVGHYQPRQPADLGYYDLRVPEVMQHQAALAKRYGIDGFCFYYYWFNGKRLLEQPLEHLLGDGAVDMPFCLCWANENWTRRWDGRDSEILMVQNHGDADDLRVIEDLMRYFRSPNYIRVNGKLLLIIYRVTLFPDFKRTASRWRKACREAGVGELHLTMVESFELVHKGALPSEYGCDAAVEFPPQELAEVRQPSGEIINPEFEGQVADYRDLAVRYATRPNPGYCRFRGVSAGWDNTARRQNNSFCFEQATPGAFQAWLEKSVEKTKDELSGDERIIFINAWNEWAEGAYLEPDRRFGHTFLEAVRNARESAHLQRLHKYMLGD
jgi:lipopolysaccharide biosynthesis protein